MDAFQKSAEFKAAVSVLKSKGVADKAAAKARGTCSSLAIDVQANVAALYAVTRAWDKVHNPTADADASLIRAALAESKANPATIAKACSDALAICRHESFEGIESAAEFKAAFESLELTTAAKVRAYALGTKADPIGKLVRAVRALSTADRATFEKLLAAADAKVTIVKEAKVA